ncbi:Predicted protein [Lactobacillus helveticus H10]|nr:Predicted protein [Lactobacillus helveticus H10]
MVKEGISIHALTRSATILTRSCLNVLYISIHALTRSATTDTMLTGRNLGGFQSTHSQGVRLDSPDFGYFPSIFQSTHSQGVRP